MDQKIATQSSILTKYRFCDYMVNIDYVNRKGNTHITNIANGEQIQELKKAYKPNKTKDNGL